MKVGNTVFEVVRGSVTDQEVDAIVNAANGAMRGGGGIDGRIHRSAGSGLMMELIRVAPGGAKTGQPVVTGAHNLPQKHIIHVAGPVWRGGNKGEPELLADCYRNCLAESDKLSLASIAFCSISTGIYGYPLADAAKIAVATAVAYVRNHAETTLTRIVFAMYGQEEFDVFERTVAEAAG
jgi:O-acetyl-ADP-ribose deacetylase (regulator of RNase III)